MTFFYYNFQTQFTQRKKKVVGRGKPQVSTVERNNGILQVVDSIDILK